MNHTLIKVPIRFRKENVHALIDTGAAVSVIALLLFQKLSSSGKVKLYHDHSIVFKSATGNELMVTGYFKLAFQLGGCLFHHPFYVINNLTEECIIGMDFLMNTIFSVNGPEKVFRIETEGTVVELSFNKLLNRNEVNSVIAVSLP